MADKLDPYTSFRDFVVYCQYNGADVRYGKNCVVINYNGRTTTAHKFHGTDKWDSGLTKTKLRQLGLPIKE